MKMPARTRSGKSAPAPGSDTTERNSRRAVAALTETHAAVAALTETHAAVATLTETHAAQHRWCCRACITGDGGADGRKAARLSEMVRAAGRTPRLAQTQAKLTQMLQLRDKRRPFS